MQDEVNTKVVAIMIKGGKISAEVLKKALDKFVQEIEKAQKQMQQSKCTHGYCVCLTGSCSLLPERTLCGCYSA